jgi:hypothetical protein
VNEIDDDAVLVEGDEERRLVPVHAVLIPPGDHVAHLPDLVGAAEKVPHLGVLRLADANPVDVRGRDRVASREGE